MHRKFKQYVFKITYLNILFKHLLKLWLIRLIRRQQSRWLALFFRDGPDGTAPDQTTHILATLISLLINKKNQALDCTPFHHFYLPTYVSVTQYCSDPVWVCLFYIWERICQVCGAAFMRQHHIYCLLIFMFMVSRLSFRKLKAICECSQFSYI